MKLCGMDGFLKNKHAPYRRESCNTGRCIGRHMKWHQGVLSKWWKTRIKNSNLTQKNYGAFKFLLIGTLTVVTNLWE